MRTPAADHILNRIGIVVRAEAKLGASGARAFMDTGMDELIEHQQIAPLRQRREHGEIGDIATGEKDRRFRAEKSRGLGFKAFVLGAIAAQQPRSSGADGSTGFNRSRNGLLHPRTASQRKIVVGGEIYAGARPQAPQPIVVLQRIKSRNVACGLVHACA